VAIFLSYSFSCGYLIYIIWCWVQLKLFLFSAMSNPKQPFTFSTFICVFEARFFDSKKSTFLSERYGSRSPYSSTRYRSRSWYALYPWAS
jgi:hypothetical protein